METAGLAGCSGNRFDAPLPVSDLTFWIWCTPDRAPHQPESPPVHFFAFTLPAHGQLGPCGTAPLAEWGWELHHREDF